MFVEISKKLSEEEKKSSGLEEMISMLNEQKMSHLNDLEKSKKTSEKLTQELNESQSKDESCLRYQIYFDFLCHSAYFYNFITFLGN